MVGSLYFTTKRRIVLVIGEGWVGIRVGSQFGGRGRVFSETGSRLALSRECEHKCGRGFTRWRRRVARRMADEWPSVRNSVSQIGVEKHVLTGEIACDQRVTT